MGDWLWIRDKFESAGFGCVLFVLSFSRLVLAAADGEKKTSKALMLPGVRKLFLDYKYCKLTTGKILCCGKK